MECLEGKNRVCSGCASDRDQAATEEAVRTGTQREGGRTVYLLRHGATPGNLEKRYVGRTDESLSPAEIERLRPIAPLAERALFLFVSPMKRCRETAALLFPGVPQRIVQDLRECDFGAFEYRNYVEMADDPAYVAWVEGGGVDPFPEGESPTAFRKRTTDAWRRVMQSLHEEDPSGEKPAVFVVHGGTVMAVMEAHGLPRRGYFDWQVSNGSGVLGRWDVVNEKLQFVKYVGAVRDGKDD